MNKQKVDFIKDNLSFQVGTGKDAKIFIKFALKKDNEVLIYNIPLLTLNSIQIWSSKPKVPIYVMGSAQPKGLGQGVKQITGFIVTTTENESLGTILRRNLKNYRPVTASNLNLDTDGLITINQLDKLHYLDQLPPCSIHIYISNPTTGFVFSKGIYGVSFVSESHDVGRSPTMGAQYSFIAVDAGPIIKEDVSQEVTDAK